MTGVTHPDAAVELSVVIPAYNEEDNLVPLLDQLMPVLSSLGRSYEVLLVDDGSTDRTAAVMTRLQEKYPPVRVIRHRGNHGLSAALDTGFKNVRGAIVAGLDADLQNDPADLPLLLSKLDEADVAIGWRHERNDPFVKRLSSKIANGIRNRMTHEQIHDTGCTLKVFRREYLDKLKMFNGLHRFLPTLLKMEGARVLQVKVRHHPRLHGEAKYHLTNRLLGPFLDLFAVRWMQKRHLSAQWDEVPRAK